VSAKEREGVGELPFEGQENAVPAPAESAPARKPADKPKEKALEHPFPFSVTVGKVYDGPLDLLLDLIRKQDIDIWDIPIARITAQFLSYVEQLKETDVDNAGEFIYTASLLIHIKSRMLLPREPREGLEDSAEDPRMELVERLLEHERFKNAAQMLLQKQQIEAATWTRPQLKSFLNEAGMEGAIEGEIAADVPDLVRVFRDILDRLRERPVLDMEEDAVTVGQMIDYVRRRLLMEDGPVALSRMLANSRSERSLIAMFLALLEMVRLQAILLRQDANFAEVFVKKQDGFETLMEERMRSLKDDWQ
jgi:segregation and condensation protein A